MKGSSNARTWRARRPSEVIDRRRAAGVVGGGRHRAVELVRFVRGGRVRIRRDRMANVATADLRMLIHQTFHKFHLREGFDLPNVPKALLNRLIECTPSFL